MSWWENESKAFLHKAVIMNDTFVLPEYLAQGQWNKERLKEQWTGNDVHVTLHTSVNENSTYVEATPTLR